jgi:hypothetical protein
MKIKLSSFFKQLSDNRTAILAGLAVPGILGLLLARFAEPGWRWIKIAATSLFAPGGDFARSWPWATPLIIYWRGKLPSEWS